MPEAFVSLRDLLVPAPTRPGQAPETTCTLSEEPPDDEELAASVRRFRAGLLDAFDLVCERLLREVASQVLARELHLDSADIASVVSQALERIESPLAIHVSPSDADALAAFDLHVVADPSLRRGDVVLRCEMVRSMFPWAYGSIACCVA